MDYIEAFKNLKTNQKYSRKSPHKAVLLLAIIDLYESCTLADNVIKYDEILKDAFVRVWNKVLPYESTFHSDAYLPFWYMQSEGFWHIVPIRGKDDILSVLRDNHVKPSEAKLLDCVNYAELDEDLYFMMTLKSGRSSLRKVLLENYTNLSVRKIEELSVSNDNFVDNSETALNEYVSIIQASATEKPHTETTVDSESEKRFKSLKEDIQYVLYIEYYSFLKRSINEREMIKEIIPDVYTLYDRISNNFIKQGNIAPSISFVYENFLADLKITLMSEDDSFELIDKINEAIQCLHEMESQAEPADTGVTAEGKDDDYLNQSTNSEQEVALPKFVNRERKPLVDEDELIKFCYEQGYSIDDIAQRLGKSESYIREQLADLRLIERTKDDVDEETPLAEEQQEDEALDFYVENRIGRCYIYNRLGQKVYSDKGKLKIIRNKVYRFNWKSMCLTVKSIRKVGDKWFKGDKLLVAYSASDLYNATNEDNYIYDIEDFTEASYMYLNSIKVRGKWYDYQGGLIVSGENKKIIVNSGINDPLDNDKVAEDTSTDYVPKGKIKNIDDVATQSFDYLWLLAIADFMGEKQHSTFLSFDELACMMIANAWVMLNNHPEYKNVEDSLTDCIDFLIGESKEFMDQELSWESSKDEIYETIKDFPMSGCFEDIVDEILERSPYTVLKLWIQDSDEEDMVIESKTFKNAALYGLHLKKRDPYIEVNPKWKSSLYYDNNDLTAWLRERYIDFLKEC